MLFFEASDHDLVKRFSETRRRHPLVQKEGILSAINREREIMSELRKLATMILDSSGTDGSSTATEGPGGGPWR